MRRAPWKHEKTNAAMTTIARETTVNNVTAFPLSAVMGWRDENRRKAEINRINERIAAKEREIAKLGHDIWLLKLEREGLSNG